MIHEEKQKIANQKNTNIDTSPIESIFYLCNANVNLYRSYNSCKNMKIIPWYSRQKRYMDGNCNRWQGGDILLTIIRVVLAIIVLVLSGYSSITNNLVLFPFMMLFLGALMLVNGIGVLQKDKKDFGGFLSIAAFVLALITSIELFLS